VVDVYTLGVLAAVGAIFTFLIVAAGLSYRRDLRGVGALEHWADRNGWSFSQDAIGEPPWAGWSPAMIASEVSRLQPNDEMRVLGNVGPVLTGVLDGSEVSLATVRWVRGVDEEGASTTPYMSSLFVAVHVPESLPAVTVRHRPSTQVPTAGGLFGARCLVVPGEAGALIPEALKEAHLAREVSPWTVHDGRLVSICRHQVYELFPPTKTLLPAARRALRAARLLTEPVSDEDALAEAMRLSGAKTKGHSQPGIAGVHRPVWCLPGTRAWLRYVRVVSRAGSRVGWAGRGLPVAALA
jgi:hypothetical protein